jgi:predicted nucleotidyltransferase
VNIELPRRELEAFCKRWKITEVALFGSVLREDFRPDSDIDMLVTFATEARWSLFDHVTMQDELEEIFGREVDLMTRRSVEESRNAFRRRAILSTATPVYVVA